MPPSGSGTDAWFNRVKAKEALQKADAMSSELQEMTAKASRLQSELANLRTSMDKQSEELASASGSAVRVLSL